MKTETDADMSVFAAKFVGFPCNGAVSRTANSHTFVKILIIIIKSLEEDGTVHWNRVIRGQARVLSPNSFAPRLKLRVSSLQSWVPSSEFLVYRRRINCFKNNHQSIVKVLSRPIYTVPPMHQILIKIFLDIPKTIRTKFIAFWKSSRIASSCRKCNSKKMFRRSNVGRCAVALRTNGAISSHRISLMVICTKNPTIWQLLSEKKKSRKICSAIARVSRRQFSASIRRP